MEKEGRGNHCSSREDGAAGEGAGGLFYGWDTCHQELHCVKHLGF